ncbi:ABC transporter substrate-binding protein [Vibrio sp. VB16]|uniref:ABC transporter substrate-binding protein n=1 Tax=Vibrio sp. VB16 TaxID=2785746 RepID=UPI0018A0596B|nr:ABC transporter substrate-binding protein [Vibrio sp. VB16]UGA53588.1 ABC transporter substrate-binding protein [Vibrio sp. VB16]
MNKVTALFLSLISVSASAQTDLLLYTSQPNQDAQQTVAAFEKQNPEIRVNWIRDGTTKLMARFQAEQEAGVKSPDMLLIADSVTMESLKQKDLLYPYASKYQKNYDPAVYEPQGFYHGTKMITTGIAYNTQANFKPDSWWDLTKPEAKNLTAMPSPLYSGAALIHLATLTENKNIGWNYYQELKNNEVKAQGGNGGVLTALSSGTKAYGAIVDFLAIREKAKGAPIEFVFPKEGVSMVTEPVAILASSKQKEAAQKFVDFLLSNQGQEMVKAQGYLPASNEVGTPEGFPPRDKIKLLSFNADSALKNANENKNRFAEIFN